MYSPPPKLKTPTSLSIPINARFDDTAELIAADAWTPYGTKEGDSIGVKLVWRVIAPTEKPYALSIYLVGPDGQPYGGMVTYPGYGKLATSVWQTGYIFDETYWFPVSPTGPTPASGQIQVKLFNKKAKPRELKVYDNRGHPLGDMALFGSIRIDSALPAPQIDSPTLATFGNVAELKRIHVLPEPQHPGGVLPIWLEWQALGPGPADLIVSFQLWDAENKPVLGHDGPVSSVLKAEHWQDGDLLHTVRWLSLPDDLSPGAYKLVTTLYHGNDLTRLPATDAQGNPLPDNFYQLSEITIK